MDGTSKTLCQIKEARNKRFYLYESTERTKLIYADWKQISSYLESNICVWEGGEVIDWQDTQGTLGINRTTPCLDILMVKVVTKVYILNRNLSTSKTF